MEGDLVRAVRCPTPNAWHFQAASALRAACGTVRRIPFGFQESGPSAYPWLSCSVTLEKKGTLFWEDHFRGQPPKKGEKGSH